MGRTANPDTQDSGKPQQNSYDRGGDPPGDFWTNAAKAPFAGIMSGYETLYGPGAQKAALKDASGKARAFGTELRDEYDKRGRQNISRFDKARQTANEYNRNRPRFQQDLYYNTQAPSSYSNYAADRRRLEAKSPEEEFYESQLAGTNPAYIQMQKDLQRELRGAAAARGGFVSGRSMDLENRGLARLGAEEFARRGDLAQKAGIARRGRESQMDALMRDLGTQEQAFLDWKQRQAGDASGEVSGVYKDLFDMYDRYGGRTAGLQQDYDFRGLGDYRDLVGQSMGLDLQRSQVDQKTRTQAINDLMQLGGMLL